jgi:hypothetical protein
LYDIIILLQKRMKALIVLGALVGGFLVYYFARDKIFPSSDVEAANRADRFEVPAPGPIEIRQAPVYPPRVVSPSGPGAPGQAGDNVVVYGLDADLILLSMLTSLQTGIAISLLREKQEFGLNVNANVNAKEKDQEYQLIDLTEFRVRVGISNMVEVINYIGLMSLMGNDFLPHSLTHKLGDDGHECVLSVFNTMKESKKWLVNSVDGRWTMNIDVFLDIARDWSTCEDERILGMIQKKQEQARRGVSKGMDASEGLPLEWAVEKNFLKGGTLIDGWRQIYWKWMCPSGRESRMCEKYIEGCQWILDYYTAQKEVDLNWTFPSWIPPLWSDFQHFVPSQNESERASVSEIPPPTPEEQLAMVLPLESWGLIRNSKHRTLPALLPQMWPQSFSFFSVGRKWLWECEALVPVLTADRVREILNPGR